MTPLRMWMEWKQKPPCGKQIQIPTRQETLCYDSAAAFFGGVLGQTWDATARITTLKPSLGPEMIKIIADLQERNSVADWKDGNATEVQAFTGIFQATMSRARFKRINSNLRLDGRQTQLAAFRTCGIITLTSSFIPFRGKCAFWQYVPQ